MLRNNFRAPLHRDSVVQPNQHGGINSALRPAVTIPLARDKRNNFRAPLHRDSVVQPNRRGGMNSARRSAASARRC